MENQNNSAQQSSVALCQAHTTYTREVYENAYKASSSKGRKFLPIVAILYTVMIAIYLITLKDWLGSLKHLFLPAFVCIVVIALKIKTKKNIEYALQQSANLKATYLFLMIT